MTDIKKVKTSWYPFFFVAKTFYKRNYGKGIIIMMNFVHYNVS